MEEQFDRQVVQGMLQVMRGEILNQVETLIQKLRVDIRRETTADINREIEMQRPPISSCQHVWNIISFLTIMISAIIALVQTFRGQNKDLATAISVGATLLRHLVEFLKSVYSIVISIMNWFTSNPPPPSQAQRPAQPVREINMDAIQQALDDQLPPKKELRQKKK